MPNWEDFADFKIWERKKPVETFTRVKHNFIGDEHEGIFALNNWHLRFVEYRKRFLRGIVENDFTGSLLKPPLSIDGIIDRQVSRTDPTVFYVIPTDLRKYEHNLVNVGPKINSLGRAMRFKLSSEDELSRFSNSLSNKKAIYEEWKEKTQIKGFKCEHCGAPNYSITGPSIVSCDNCGREYSNIK